MKMTFNAHTIVSTKYNLCLLTYVEMLLGLNVLMPLLEVLYSLLKFAQLSDVFVCDFIAMVKICEGDIYGCIVTTILVSKIMCLETSML